MKTIWKFPLEVTDYQNVRMPKGAEILSVADQYGVVCVWAMVDSDAELEDRMFYIFGTGNPVSETLPWQFVGSVQQNIFVWHVFAEVK
jgi:hypothetical protein